MSPPQRELEAIGTRFGRLLVIAADRQRTGTTGRSYLIVRCDCGVEKSTRYDGLLSGATVSCGCKKKTHGLKHGHSRTGSRTSEYLSWATMVARCTNPKATGYEHYGGRGITVCTHWLNSFENFISDMGDKPGAGYSLERIDNARPYEPGNCKWATRMEQMRNTRRVVTITVNGETRCVEAWGMVFGVSARTIRSRLRLGWTPEDAVTRPVKKRNT